LLIAVYPPARRAGPGVCWHGPRGGADCGADSRRLIPDSYSWPWIFFITPIGAFCGEGGARPLETTGGYQSSADGLRGLLSLIVGVVALQSCLARQTWIGSIELIVIWLVISG